MIEGSHDMFDNKGEYYAQDGAVLVRSIRYTNTSVVVVLEPASYFANNTGSPRFHSIYHRVKDV